MVRGVLMVVLAGMLVAGTAIASESVTVKVTAMRATVEGAEPKVFDSGLEDVRRAVGSMDFDTFRKIAVKRVSVEYGEESKVPLNKRYTLFIKPREKDAKGRCYMQIRIEEQPADPKKKPVTALKFTTHVAPGGKIIPNGLPLEDDGTLVLVLQVAK